MVGPMPASKCSCDTMLVLEHRTARHTKQRIDVALETVEPKDSR
jgi:hypothetical protein